MPEGNTFRAGEIIPCLQMAVHWQRQPKHRDPGRRHKDTTRLVSLSGVAGSWLFPDWDYAGTVLPCVASPESARSHLRPSVGS